MDGDLNTKKLYNNDMKGLMIRIFEDLYKIINEDINKEIEW